jgi:hypothetical protein
MLRIPGMRARSVSSAAATMTAVAFRGSLAIRVLWSLRKDTNTPHNHAVVAQRDLHLD